MSVDVSIKLWKSCVTHDMLEKKKKKKKKKKFLFKVEQNGKYNTSEFAITSTSHTICTT